MQQFRPHPSLSPYIESLLLQEDLNPVNYANRTPVNVLPSTLAVIGIQYGSRMKTIGAEGEQLLGTSGIAGLQTTVKQYVGTGGIGTIIVRFKPGGLAAFAPYPIQAFQDANVDLHAVFPPRLVGEMEERLREAGTAPARIAVVQAFLRAVLTQRDREPWIAEAARLIELHRGGVSIERLAGEFYVSKRTLERKFNELIGISPKKFAGIVRFQHAVQLRKTGRDYLDIVTLCGFADHAHFAHAFKSYAGLRPELFFREGEESELAKRFNGKNADSADAPDSPDAPSMYR